MWKLPGDWPSRELVAAYLCSIAVGFGLLLGYIFLIQEVVPQGSLLFLGVFLCVYALLYRIEYLERRVARLELADLSRRAKVHVKGAKIRITDAEALSSLPPVERFVSLVLLLALRNGADFVRFERVAEGWSISARAGEEWEDYVPVGEAIDVRRLITWLSRPRGLANIWTYWSLPTDSGGFVLELGDGLVVSCLASESDGGKQVMLSLFPTESMEERAAELLSAFKHRPCEGEGAA